MIAGLFVETNGIYFNDPDIDPWDIERDAMKYSGPYPVIAHPPCKRWGRYWSGGPSVKVKRHKGDDNGMFAKALWAVRTFGGVIEHPEASHAWDWYGLNKPYKNGGWQVADKFGALTCCVAQGHYGHSAQKFTWLYYIGDNPKELIWGPCKGKMKMELSPHSREQAKQIRSDPGYKPVRRISAAERLGTPPGFKELLKELINPHHGAGEEDKERE